MNQLGYHTVKGNSFSTTAVKDILHNKIYGGYLEYARYVDWDSKRRKGKNPTPILVKGTQESLISEETYHAVQERLDLESKQPNWNHTGQNILTGLLRCLECGAAMTASNVTNTLKDGTKKRIRYYSCSVFRNKGASVCHANWIRADKAERSVADRLKELVKQSKILEKVIQALNEERIGQVQPLNQERQAVKLEKQKSIETIEKWQKVLEENPELVDTLKDRLEELHSLRREKQVRENEIIEILAHKDELIEAHDIQKIVTGIDQLLANQEKQVIKQLYRTFIKQITFDPVTKEHIQLTMYFDQPIIDELIKHYQETVSQTKDTVLFVLETPVELMI